MKLASAMNRCARLLLLFQRRAAKIILLAGAIILGGLLLPENAMIPVTDATPKDWHPNSFWYEPWGTSGTHKGIDIFARTGQPVCAAVSGLVLFRGQIAKGGNVVLMLGPKWRLHYYAHLQEITYESGLWISRGEQLGSVGSTGNAQGKPPHLHYSVLSLLPMPWRFSGKKTQGWKLMFFINPVDIFTHAQGRLSK
jgi:peptidoglycan LD-endopeptidase LytH